MTCECEHPFGYLRYETMNSECVPEGNTLLELVFVCKKCGAKLTMWHFFE